ncbi:hypothetical protein CFO_g3654 [Ceratocystis platani]|uniref:Uncharacterized protein n=1 Tax=Ceratocystis fimbriata f. sp. platani TaxID=88771 RepID=A0A0F8AZL1_CERFI|nr:hypothetical protein CFO_g3654 [Ceratocystis platani]
MHTGLAEAHKRKPGNVDWTVTEAVEDPAMQNFVLSIREDRSVGFKEEATKVPGDKEWNEMLGTKYYSKDAPAALPAFSWKFGAS